MTTSEIIAVHPDGDNRQRTMMVMDRMDPQTFISLMGKSFAQSGAGGCKTTADGEVMALACLCQGKTIFEIARRYHLMDGKLSLKSETMLADFRRLGGTHKWLKDGTDGVTAELHLIGPDKVEVQCSFTIQRAITAGYVKPASNWAKRPDQMLRARCISDGIRMQWPEIAQDYTQEEVEDGFSGSVPAKIESKPAPKSSVAKPVTAKPALPVSEPAAGLAVTKDEEIIEVTAVPVIVATAAATAPAETTVEKPPFEVAEEKTLTVDVTVPGESDESGLKYDGQFDTNVMDCQILIAKMGWKESDILARFNGKFQTNHSDWSGFDTAQIELILTNIRKVHDQHQATLLAAK
jgi:hypothetical protein